MTYIFFLSLILCVTEQEAELSELVRIPYILMDITPKARQAGPVGRWGVSVCLCPARGEPVVVGIFIYLLRFLLNVYVILPRPPPE